MMTESSQPMPSRHNLMDNSLPVSDHMAAGGLVEAVRREIHYLYQPIVSACSGLCYGYEALIQGHDRVGFASAAELFDHARTTGDAIEIDQILREKAVRDFVRFSISGDRLLINIDSHLDLSPGDANRWSEEMLSRFNLSPTAVCLALSETLLHPGSTVRASLEGYRRQAFHIGLDRFGSDTGGLRTLYEHNPTVLRVDRFLTGGIHQDERKKLFVATVANLAHVLGITMIADGIANEEDFRTCKQIGCDLVQGGFIAPAAGIGAAFNRSYTVIAETNRRERRERRSDQRLLREELAQVSPLRVNDPMAKVFQAFRSQKELDFLPIVDERYHPVGIIREVDLKDVIYSRYGKDLLHNKALHRGLLDFLHPCPACDIDMEAEKILETFSQAANPPGILLVDDFKYVGVLNASSLLRVINEKNLVQARDQNPLTRLPGNSCIADHLTAALEAPAVSWIFAYFDLDNFKPFNDRYGFRQGDRAILLFSELMRSTLGNNQTFLGHIGGDDFFASFRDITPEIAVQRIEGILAAFRRDVESFYDPDSRGRGYIVGRGRDGVSQHFPLLTCSAALVHIPAGERSVTVDDVGDAIAILKKAAKISPDHIALKRLS